MRYPISIVLLLLCVVLQGQPVGYSENCTLTELNGQTIPITDFDTISLRFNITDADDPDLAGFQSVCSVRLNFEHNNLSDLEITLTSPNGQKVTLVGPATGVGTQPSPFIAINFDVFFVARPAADDPHPFLMSPWSNNLGGSWLGASDYGGIYYPHNGDLAVDFDEGSVLGIWELTIIDRFLNSEGEFFGFEIDFCEDDGVVCDICESEEGSFIDTIITQCVSEDLDLESLYTAGNADPALYTSEFLIYDDAGTLVSTDAPGMGVSSLDTGTYIIHGLNILTTQYDTAATGLASLSRAEMIDSVEALGGVLCMSLSDPINIQLSIPDTTRSDEVLCFGDSLIFHDEVIKTSGVYTHTSSDCREIEILTVEASNLFVALDRDTIELDCAPDFVIFSPTVENPSGAVTYQWSQVGGLILDVNPSITIDTPGQYQVVIADDLCDTTLFFEVVRPGDDYVLSVVAIPTNLNCVSDSSILVYTNNFTAQNVNWYQDGGLIAQNVSEITVFDEAVYEVEVMGDRGCILRESVNITTDQAEPAADVNFSDLTCTSSTFTADYTTTDDIHTAIWLQGSDTLNIGPDALISAPDDYTLVLIGNNFCQSEFPFTVDSDVDPIEINDVPSGTVVLDCNTPTITVEPDRDDTEIVEEYWILRVDDTLRGSKNIAVLEATSYRYEVLTTNGCRQTERFDVVIDTISPTYSLVPDSITCDNLMPEIILSDLGPDVTASFSGANVVAQTDSSVVVSASGVVDYVLTNNRTGCSITGSYDVPIDEAIPNVTLSGDSLITCSTTQARVEADFNGVALADFFWVSPVNDTFTQRTYVTTDTGLHVFSGVGFNGCTFVDTFEVGFDDDLPSINLANEVVVSCTSPNISIELEDLTNIQSVRWVLDGDTILGSSVDTLSRSTSIEVIVEGNNFCPNSRILNIRYDTLNPQVTLIADTLNCNNATVIISPDVLLDNHELTWAGQDVSGFATPTVEVNQPGAYALNVIDTISGCDTLIVIDVMDDYNPPIYSINPVDTLTCDRTSVSLSVATNPRYTVDWTTSLGNPLSGPTVLSTDPGKHIFSVQGTNGCIAVDSLILQDDTAAPIVNIQDTYVISCDESSFDVTPDILDPFRSVAWQYKNGRVDLNLSQTILDDNLESVEITGDNGCPTVVAFDITFSDDNPKAEINTLDSNVCDGQSIFIETDPVISTNHQIFWTLAGNAVATDVISTSVDQSGEYVLEVIDTTSGCSSFDTVVIFIAPTPLSAINAAVQDETCLGNNDGFITVNNIEGGEDPLILTLDAEEINIGIDEFRPPGTYQLQVEDDFGCTYDTTVSILNGGSFDVDLGSDFEIDRGDKATIQANYSGEQVQTVMWRTESGLASSALDTFCFTPTMDQAVYIEAISESGCVVYDTIFITVNINLNKINLYVPNVLSQASNVGNDQLILSLPEDIREVNDFSIYDRWGQQVAFLERLVNGDVVLVWDGRFNGRNVQAGVYMYRYDMLTIYNNVWITRHGDITVVN